MRLSPVELGVAAIVLVTATALAGAVVVAGLLVQTGWLRHHGHVNVAARRAVG